MALTTTPSELTATALTLTTAAQPNITSVGTLTTLTVDDITINGSTVSDAADFTIDVGGDITLDTDGGDVFLKDGGTDFGLLANSSNNLLIRSAINDADIIFQGYDGGSTITALTLDMSAAGAATFNAGITATGLTINGGGSRQYINTGHLRLSDDYNLEWGGGTNYIRGSNASNYVYFATNSTERMRITSGGIVLIGGVTNTAGGYQFKVGGSDNQGELGLFSNATASDLLSYDRTNSHYLTLNIHAGNTNFTQGEVGIKNTSPSDTSWGAAGVNAELAIGNTSSGSAYGVLHLLGHQTQATRFSIGAGAGNLYAAYDDVAAAHRIVVNSAGSVGINHTSPEHHLHVTEPGSTNEDGIVKIGGSNSSLGLELRYDQTGSTLTQIVANPTYTNTAAIMKLCVDGDANGNQICLLGSGNVGLGTDAPGSSRLYVYQNIDAVFTAYFCNDHAGAYGVGVRSDSDSMMYFYNGGTFRGRIYHNGTTMLYADQSDYRLKENIQTMTGSIDRIKKLNPVTFDWKADKKASEGFLAHEVQTVIPTAVAGEKDAKITEHGDGIQIMDYGKLTPVLVGALQEALAKIETLETKVAALEAK